MGYDAACDIRIDGTTVRGAASLEHQTLIVRGPERLTIPLNTVTAAVAADGWMRIAFAGRIVEMALGAAAAKWATRITNPPSRLTKLGIKAGMRVLAIGALPEDFVEELRGAGAVVVRRLPAGARTPSIDLVFVVIDAVSAFERLPALASAIVPAGAIWTLRRKGDREVSEAATMAAGKRAGLVDVKVVSFSDTITAEKFVIPVAKRPGTTRRAAGGASGAATSRRAT
jgi:hypothetical protein